MWSQSTNLYKYFFSLSVYTIKVACTVPVWQSFMGSASFHKWKVKVVFRQKLGNLKQPQPREFFQVWEIQTNSPSSLFVCTVYVGWRPSSCLCDYGRNQACGWAWPWSCGRLQKWCLAIGLKKPEHSSLSSCSCQSCISSFSFSPLLLSLLTCILSAGSIIGENWASVRC